MNYVSEVSAVFQNRCPNITIISPEDYRLIAEWEKQEIPVDIVAEAINSACDRLDADTVEIRSIRYFQSTIRDNYVTWLQTGVEASHRTVH